MSDFENIGILQEGEEDINFCPHCESEKESLGDYCCDESQIELLGEQLEAKSAEIEALRDGTFVETLETFNRKLREENEALKDFIIRERNCAHHNDFLCGSEHSQATMDRFDTFVAVNDLEQPRPDGEQV